MRIVGAVPRNHYPRDYRELLEALKSGPRAAAELGPDGFGSSLEVVEETLGTLPTVRDEAERSAVVLQAIFGCMQAAFALRLRGRSSNRNSIEQLIDDAAEQIVGTAAADPDLDADTERQTLHDLDAEWDIERPETFPPEADDAFIRLAAAIANRWIESE